ncbi:Bug family tripartite tricarboxylate transporter substrate binding protein [Hydrogenophaga sp. MI9]|uniref:Bug family tripartite tricarboxylate transporter substrate binding protein n=1 Tax=Hydrogenophaga sp. MI9 TaxID=3453719 RepID=UPI003EEE80A3
MTALNLSRRHALVAASLLLAAGTAFAQAYPAKPIKVIVPFPAGGGTDLIAREVTNKIQTTKGWSFIVENRPGTGGNIGIDAVAKSPADGYTIALGQTSNLAINPTLYTKMPYDAVKDLAPVGLVASAPLVLVVGADSPFKTLADVVAASKAKPNTLNIATAGNGTVAHLASELFQKTAGVSFTHIPYKGAAGASTDVVSGRVELYISSVPTLIGFIKSGKMRPIAVTSLKRVDDLPAVPTIAESGYKGFEAATWFGFVAPTGTPKEVVTLLNAELNKALTAADLKQKISDQGADVLGGTPEAFASLIKSDLARWAPIIKASGATLD